VSNLHQRPKEPQAPTSLQFEPGDVTKIVASNDTLGIVTRLFDRDFRDQLNDSLEPGTKSVKVKRFRGYDGRLWRVYRITKPTQRTYEVVRKWNEPFSLYRVDIALDFHFASWVEARQFKQWAATAMRVRWVDSSGFWWWDEDGFHDTRYFVSFRDLKTTRRTLTLYTNKHHDHIVRLELRWLKADSVKRSGLDTIFRDWRYGIDVRSLFRRHVQVRQLKPHWLRKKVKSALARDTIRCSGRWPLWRQNLPARVVHDYGRWAHDDPNHGLPMKAVRCEELFSLIPTGLSVPL
jgi:hypothetical protein